MKLSFRPRLAALVLLAALLEAAFLALRRLLAPPPDVVGVIGVALAASVVYFAAARLAWRWVEPGRAALWVVLLAAVLFRATLFPLPPTLSNDLYRYQWEAAVQRAGHHPHRATPAPPPPRPRRRCRTPSIATSGRRPSSAPATTPIGSRRLTRLWQALAPPSTIACREKTFPRPTAR